MLNPNELYELGQTYSIPTSHTMFSHFPVFACSRWNWIKYANNIMHFRHPQSVRNTSFYDTKCSHWKLFRFWLCGQMVIWLYYWIYDWVMVAIGQRSNLTKYFHIFDFNFQSLFIGFRFEPHIYFMFDENNLITFF